jgi:hypothetical protein
MTTVVINEEYAEILSKFGNLESAIDLAVKRYTIEQITAKIAELNQKNLNYQKKYQTDYLTFCQKIQEDEHFLAQVETHIDKLWEIDLSEWEFCYQGILDWTEKLQNILLV